MSGISKIIYGQNLKRIKLPIAWSSWAYNQILQNWQTVTLTVPGRLDASVDDDVVGGAVRAGSDVKLTNNDSILSYNSNLHPIKTVKTYNRLSLSEAGSSVPFI